MVAAIGDDWEDVGTECTGDVMVGDKMAAIAGTDDTFLNSLSAVEFVFGVVTAALVVIAVVVVVNDSTTAVVIVVVK